MYEKKNWLILLKSKGNAQRWSKQTVLIAFVDYETVEKEKSHPNA